MALQDSVNVVILDVKTYNDPISGRGIDQQQVAVAVADLVKSTGCQSCLVWAKQDSIVQLVKATLPETAAGYIVMNEGLAAMEDGMHLPLRLNAPEVASLSFVTIYFSEGVPSNASRAQCTSSEKKYRRE
eukprot:scaffold39614_cov51-Prasinocladus_malaysianus.AAC.1